MGAGGPWGSETRTKSQKLLLDRGDGGYFARRFEPKHRYARDRFAAFRTVLFTLTHRQDVVLPRHLPRGAHKHSRGSGGAWRTMGAGKLSVSRDSAGALSVSRDSVALCRQQMGPVG
jgi:hypothetical protein